MEHNAMPLGFGMALAMNQAAMERFAAMTPQQKETVLKRTKQVTSKNEMQRLVAELADGSAVD